MRSHSGSSGTEFTFTGEQNDPNGLEYLRARYYDPATGRFLSRDPLGGGYPYAGGNPANMADPSGMCFLVDPDSYACAEVYVDSSPEPSPGYPTSSGGGGFLGVHCGVCGEIVHGGLDLVEAGAYGVYFVSYETLGVLEEVGPGLAVIAPFETGLMAAEALGLGGDILIDLLQGEGVRDEGHRDSIVPDFVQALLGYDPDETNGCPGCMPPIVESLPGVHPDGHVDFRCGPLRHVGIC